jgi:hypothetical protein
LRVHRGGGGCGFGRRCGRQTLLAQFAVPLEHRGHDLVRHADVLQINQILGFGERNL